MPKKLVIIFSSLPLLLLLPGCDSKAPPKEDIYPWQITLQADGKTRVFGIVINQTRVQDAAHLLGSGFKIALFENKDQSLSLEAFMQDITLGGLSAKIVVAIAANDEEKKQYRKRAKKREPLGNGVIRYILTADDNRQAANKVVNALSYIPYVSLSEDMILSRFGEPARRIVINEHKEHFLYPETGLDLLLDREGKELLQYVEPAEFNRLLAPLEQAVTSGFQVEAAPN